MFRFVVLFCALIALAKGESSVYRQCVHTAGQLPLSADINGCQHAPCQAPQLSEFTMAINFTTPYTVYSMRTRATVIFGNLVAGPYPLRPNSLACNFLTGIQCPTQPGQNLEYVLRTFVPALMPSGATFDVEFSIVDEQKKSLMCLRVPIWIAEPEFK